MYHHSGIVNEMPFTTTNTKLQENKIVQMKKFFSPLLSDQFTFVDNNKVIQFSIIIILYFSGHTKLMNHIISGIDA